VVVSGGGGGVGGPLFEQHVPGPVTQGVVGARHELGRRLAAPGRGGGVKNNGEAC